MDKTLAEIKEERKRQDEKYGIDHDDSNTISDWIATVDAFVYEDGIVRYSDGRSVPLSELSRECNRKAVERGRSKGRIKLKEVCG